MTDNLVQQIQQSFRDHGKDLSIHLYGQEINAETFAISKADLLLKGEGVEAENTNHGSTLSADAFPSREFDLLWGQDLGMRALGY